MGPYLGKAFHTTQAQKTQAQKTKYDQPVKGHVRWADECDGELKTEHPISRRQKKRSTLKRTARIKPLSPYELALQRELEALARLKIIVCYLCVF